MTATSITTPTAKMCEVESCKKEAATTCFHCNKNICKKHFDQHNDLIMVDVLSLADRINILSDRLDTVTVAKLVEQSLNDLERWRELSHLFIDKHYELKKQEIQLASGKMASKFDEYKLKHQQQVQPVKQKICEMLDEGEVTMNQLHQLRSIVSDAENELAELNASVLNLTIQDISSTNYVTVNYNMTNSNNVDRNKRTNKESGNESAHVYQRDHELNQGIAKTGATQFRFGHRKYRPSMTEGNQPEATCKQ
ncbi:unnamed protein product [Didymodactylos carnosus]|uniref:Uncharacterized protein n=1 Tax=Didymodactylos carnosus TaxID=1234261 RepID=A0A8S2QZB3_9BILA|nr:unnamed protein product [Didymodactylos carnosus]CAF4136018.1 unnamed protein product [Didymodactylos carnosus]